MPRGVCPMVSIRVWRCLNKFRGVYKWCLYMPRAVHIYIYIYIYIYICMCVCEVSRHV